jgi:hypothetical protein
MLFEFLVVSVEITKLIRQNIRVRNKIKRRFTKLFLHANHIVAKAILASDFIALREVIDLLVLVKALVKVALARGRTPEHIPLVRLSVTEPVAFEDRSQ